MSVEEDDSIEESVGPAFVAVMNLLERRLECTCEYVDIGVGFQKVAETPDYPQCTTLGLTGAIFETLGSFGVLVPEGLSLEQEMQRRVGTNNFLIFMKVGKAKGAMFRRYVTPWIPVEKG